MDIHPFIVHFPISLYFFALIFEIMRKYYSWIHENISLFTFLVACFFSIISSFSGNTLKLTIFNTQETSQLMENHGYFGSSVTIFGIIFSFLLMYVKLKFPQKEVFIFRIFIFISMTLLVFYTGFLGGKLVHGW